MARVGQRGRCGARDRDRARVADGDGAGWGRRRRGLWLLRLVLGWQLLLVRCEAVAARERNALCKSNGQNDGFNPRKRVLLSNVCTSSVYLAFNL